MSIERNVFTNIHRMLSDGIIDYEKQGILFEVNEHIDINKCKEFYLVFNCSMSIKINNKVNFYTAVNNKRYLLVNLKDMNTIPKGKIEIIFQQEKLVDKITIYPSDFMGKPYKHFEV